MLQIWHKGGDALRFWTSVVALSALAACEGATVENKFDELASRETVFGTGGITDLNSTLLGGGGDDEGGQGGAGIPVNAFLWRAALDTVSFLPLSSADPFGGVIITDWYADDPGAGERFKVNVVILGRELVADGVSARVFRQVRDPQSAGWIDAGVSTDTPTRLENAILQRARELRIASAS